MYELWFEILRDFTDYRDFMGLSLVVRLCKWSLLGLISYNLGGSVTFPNFILRPSFILSLGGGIGSIALPSAGE